MNIREKFKRRSIELIHDEDYEEAIKKELGVGCIIKHENKLKTVSFFEKSKICSGYNLMATYGDLISELRTGYDSKVDNSEFEILGFPITIGRVMEALDKMILPSHVVLLPSGNMYMFLSGVLGTPFCNWKLTKENGQECTDDDQTDETIEKLNKLIK